MQPIMRSAKQANVPSVGRAEPCKGLDVIELEKCSDIAAPTLRRNERASSLVAMVSFSPHCHGHVARTFTDRH
ncbi:MAG TPA: hypothetical protein VJV79_20405 [Polyangiaceae bacterium]|nr:hypothetical protein [Polyangiaceae bacterium]